VIEQAIYGVQAGDGYGVLARSPGFLDDWLPTAERLCRDFGERPAGVACPGCVFAQPFGGRNVAIVQAADQDFAAAGTGPLAFRLLILPVGLYDRLGGDPFPIADQFPPDWKARGDLPSLEWAVGAPPARTVDEVQKVLNVPYSAALLGGVQALLDGSRLVFERSSPDARLIRGLWALLPTCSRRDLWPASFAFGNACRFHAVVVPRADGPDFTGYVDEEQAGDYPEGRYELQLQTAVEAGDQKEMDALFARRSRRQMIRLALALLLIMAIVPPVVMLWPTPTPPAAKPNLPAAASCPALNDGERRQLADRLQQFAQRRSLDVSRETTDAALSDDIEKIDQSLGGGEPGRDPGRLRGLGPVQRQLRALLWKHGVAGYDDPGLKPVEMVKKLQDKVNAKQDDPHGE
jgi:hypothetical protein